MDCAKTTAGQDEKHLSAGIWCDLYKRFEGKPSAIFVNHWESLCQFQNNDKHHSILALNFYIDIKPSQCGFIIKSMGICYLKLS